MIRARIAEKTNDEIARLKTKGIIRPQIIEGVVGAQARAIGGACLPYFDKYILASTLLIQE